MLAGLKRTLWVLAIGLAALSGFGLSYQGVATLIDQHRYPPVGQLVTVNGIHLHLVCMGESRLGRPTVVLEPGLGAPSTVWAWVQPEVAQMTRVCAYDRAGLGWSDPSSTPRDARHIAADLHALLHSAHVPGPYVLAGWSFGGLYTRVFADQYPDEVAGLVLIDSSSPDQCTSTPAGQAQCASTAQIFNMAPILARLGIMRLLAHTQPASGLPAPQSGELLAASSATKDWDTQSAEYGAWSASSAQASQAGALGDRPLVVLSATDHGTPADLEALWQEWQAGFTQLSTDSAQRVVDGATHVSLVMDEHHAQETVNAIVWVVEAVQSGQPLGED